MKQTGFLAFCGSKGSGKSTSYNFFKELSTLPVEEIALAGHLKEVCARVFGVDYNLFIDPKLKEVELDKYIVLSRDTLTAVFKEFYVENIDTDKNVRPHVGRVLQTPRTLLQYIGTEVLHPVDPLIHVKIALRKKDTNKLTVITDLRFEQEFNYFNENLSSSFMPVYVKNSAAEAAASTDGHASERELHSFKDKCYRIENEFGLAELRGRIESLTNEFYNGGQTNAVIRES